MLMMTTFVTLDGVMQAPGAPDEDRSGGFSHGGWLVPYADPAMGEIVAESMARADAFLLGHGTYDIFASHWPRVTDPADPIATALNGRPKHVVATRPVDTSKWSPVSVVSGDVPRAIRELKGRYPRELQVHGSAGLAQTLLEHALVDELRLWVYPIVLGTGKRLFGPGATPAAMKLVDSKTTSTGVAVLTYRAAGKPSYGSFALDP